MKYIDELKKIAAALSIDEPGLELEQQLDNFIEENGDWVINELIPLRSKILDKVKQDLPDWGKKEFAIAEKALGEEKPSDRRLLAIYLMFWFAFNKLRRG